MTTPDSPSTVFVDTSLGTHLAMAVSDGDTVSDVKEKIVKEHPLCFPHLGNIRIQAIKVMREGFFYHLSDSMYLKSAFVGFNHSWFLSIDASTVDGHSADTSIDGINLARNNVASQLKGNVTRHYVNEKAPLMIKTADITLSVENCSKDQLGKGLNKTFESLPTVKVKNHKSKKRKTKLINEREVRNRTSDDNDQNPLQQVVGSCEKIRECEHNEVSNLPMMESNSNVDEPGQISSSNTRDESEHGMKQKYNLSEKTKVDGKNNKSKNAVHLMDNSSFEVAAQARSTANKMHMTEIISGVINGAGGNRDLVSDSSKTTSGPKVTSEYLSDMNQTAKVVLRSLSTEPDASLLETGSSDAKKRKRKKKGRLSGSPNLAVCLISSRVGDGQDASRESDITTVPSPDIEEASIPNLIGTSVRERHNDSVDKTAKDFASSLIGESCGNKNNVELGDVESIKDASDKAVLGVKRAIDSKDLASKSKDPADLQKTISTSEDANNVQSNHLTCKTGTVVAIPEERDSLQNAATKASMVENCHSSSWDGTDTNIKATHISELVHLKGTTENVKHDKKKKTKKSRGSTEVRQINLVTTGAGDSAHDIPQSEPQSITLGDNSCSKVEIGEINVSIMKGENSTSASTLLNVENIDIDEPNISQVEPLLQINKTQAVAEDMNGQVSKKNKKRPAPSMKSTPDLQPDSIGIEDSLQSKISDRKEKSVFIAEKKTKFSKVKSTNEIEEANLDSTLFSEVESTSNCKKSKTVGSSLTPSHVSEGYEGRSFEANRCSNTTKDGATDNVENRVEDPSESNKVDIEEKVDGLPLESVKFHVDKLSKERSANTLLKAKRKKKNSSACSSATSLSMQNIQKPDENTGIGGPYQTSNSSALKLHESSSKDKCDGTLHVDKLKKFSRGGAKSLTSNEHKQKMSDSNKSTRVREKVVDSSRDSTEMYNGTSALPRTRSKLKKSANMDHRDQKHMGRQSTANGHPVGGRKSSQSAKKDDTQSEQRNLLGTSGGIFKDASSDSSEDEGGIADSDASTRSPDNSLTSDFSDGESNGSVDLQRSNIRRRSMRKRAPSSPEHMSLDTILRSSSRYKKAKLTAASELQQDDTES